MRFRKSVKIAPGVKLNLSKSGVTTTGAKATVGIPGSGLSHDIQLTKCKGKATHQVDSSHAEA